MFSLEIPSNQSEKNSIMYKSINHHQLNRNSDALLILIASHASQNSRVSNQRLPAKKVYERLGSQEVKSEKSRCKDNQKKRSRKHNEQIQKNDRMMMTNEGQKQKGRRTKNYYGTWKYFNKMMIQNVIYGQCHICKKHVFVTTGTTVQLIRHLQNEHKNIIIYNPHSQEDYESLLAREISLTLISYESIQKMAFLRQLTSLRKFKHEFNRSKVSLLIKKEYFTKKFHQKEELNKSAIPPFSLYIDEYHLNSRKFYSIFVRDSLSKPFHISLLRHYSTDTYGDLYERVIKDLRSLQIENDKIQWVVSANNDMMLNLAKMGGWKHQSCLLRMLEGLLASFFHKSNASNVVEEHNGPINDEEYESEEEKETLPQYNIIEYKFQGHQSQVKIQNVPSVAETAFFKLKQIMKVVKHHVLFRKMIEVDRQQRGIRKGCRRWKDFGVLIRLYDKNRMEINQILDKYKKVSLKLSNSQHKTVMEILPTLEILQYSIITLAQSEDSSLIGAQKLISKITLLLMKPEYRHGKYLSQILLNQYAQHRNTKLICMNYYLINKAIYENRLKHLTKWTTMPIEQVQSCILSQYDQQQDTVSISSSKVINMFDKLYSNKFESKVLCLQAELKEYRKSGMRGVRLNAILQRVKSIHSHSSIDGFGFEALRTMEISNKWKISSESIKYLAFLHYYHKNMQEESPDTTKKELKIEESESSGWSFDFMD